MNEQWFQEIGVLRVKVQSASKEELFEWMFRFEEERLALVAAGKRSKLSHIFREINRYYYSVIKDQLINRIVFLKEREVLSQYRIKKGGVNRWIPGTDANHWMMVAAVYTWGKALRVEQQQIELERQTFRSILPRAWLEAAKNDDDEAYRCWLHAVDGKWFLFQKSYTRDMHLAIVDASGRIESGYLSSFTNGELTRPAIYPFPYWPVPLESYIYDKDGKKLYRAVMSERKLAKLNTWGLAGNISFSPSVSPWDVTPDWLKIGMEEVEKCLQPN